MKFIVVIALLMCVRAFLAAINNSSWSDFRYQLHSRWAWCLILFLSAVLSTITARTARRWFNAGTTWLLAVVAGAVGTAVFGSWPGAAVGAICGAFVVSPNARKVLKNVLGAMLIHGFVPLVFSILVGFVFGFVRPQFAIDQHLAVAVCVFVLGIVVISFWQLIVCRWDASRQRPNRMSKSILIPASIVLGTCVSTFGWLVGVEIENRVTQQRLAQLGHIATTRTWGWRERSLYGSTLATTLNTAWTAPDDDFALLKRVPHLTGLSIESENVTDIGFGNVKYLTKLETLSVRKAKISNEALKACRALDELRYLWLDDLPLDDESFVGVLPKKQLVALQLSGTRIGDATLKQLQNCSSLTQLYLDGTKVTDSGLKYLSKLPLRGISLANTCIRGDGLADLAKVRTLNSINLNQTELIADHISHLKKLPRLFDLRIDSIEVDDNAMANISQMPMLMSLDITGSKVSDELVGALPILAQVDFDCSNVSQAAIMKLIKQETQVNLSISDREITVGDVQRLIPLQQEIMCFDCTITDDAIEELKKIRDPSRFLFHSLNVHDEGLAILRTNPSVAVH